jgi:predicted nucleotidyltransferase
MQQGTMTDATALTRENPILAKFSAAFTEMYCDRFERVVLFGSRARGDAQPNSDYDVAVLLNGLNGPSDRWAELRKLADLRVSGRGAAPLHQPASISYVLCSRRNALP